MQRPQIRAMAAEIIGQVLQQGRSLSYLLSPNCLHLTECDRALLQLLCFGTLRTLPLLEWYLQQLMAVPLVKKQPLLHYLLLVGCYQLNYTRIPAYAAISETVNGAVALKRASFKGVINGVLRQFLRQKERLTEHGNLPEVCRYLHPAWLLQRLKVAYPKQWQQIVTENNRPPPLWLRVNRCQGTRDAYLARLAAAGLEGMTHSTLPDAIYLPVAVPVSLLPEFSEGSVTVQDASAQRCVELLEPNAGESILDLCAAPGGKTTHILEYAPQAKVWAVDSDPHRLQRVATNLQRLKQHAKLICGDATTPQVWCKGHYFDRILLDAPCSATGVIRRHPDIKWLRRTEDIDQLVAQQQAMLQAIWPFLKPGGVLVYATCSVLPEENSQQINTFLQTTGSATWVMENEHSVPGGQQLPQTGGGDGFFYAKLIKKRAKSANEGI